MFHKKKSFWQRFTCTTEKFYGTLALWWDKELKVELSKPNYVQLGMWSAYQMVSRTFIPRIYEFSIAAASKGYIFINWKILKSRLTY